MAVNIGSDDSTDESRIDPISKGLRVSGYKTDGSILPSYSVRNHYRASTATNLITAANTSAFFAIQGSSSKTIRIISVKFSGMTLTTSEYQTIICSKRSSSINGGTSTALTMIPNDSSFPAGTLNLINVYTAAPTAGTLIGVIASKRFLAASTTPTTLDVEDKIFDFYENTEDGIVLRGISEGLTLSFATAPTTAVTMAIEVVWSEE